jgi:hypothetical protein
MSCLAWAMLTILMLMMAAIWLAAIIVGLQ